MRGRKTLTILATLCALIALGIVWFAIKKKPATPHSPATSSSAPAPRTPTDPSSPEPEPEPDPEPAPTWGPSAEQLDAARDAAAAMSDEELAGQVLIAHWPGTDPETAAQTLADFHVAGVILMGENIVDAGQIERVSGGVQNEQQKLGRDWPAIVSVDQEGGRVARLRDVIDPVPAFAKLAEGGPKSVTNAYSRMGQQMRELGFTLDFAPIADVSIGAADPTIGDRSAGSDASAVAEAVIAGVEGLEAGGIVPVIKHFPGHGSVTVDSHEAVPTQERTLAELRENDFVPFVEATKNGAPVVMMGHIALAGIDPKTPATLSPKVYKLLRDELEFDGVIVTDAMNMKAITRGREAGEETVEALAAGADLILMPPNTKAAHSAIVDALKSGELEREQLEASAARVIALQMWGAGL